MVGKLITLPLRVGVRVTQLWLRAAGEAAGMAYDVATQLLEREGQPERPVTPATPATVAQERARRPVPPTPVGTSGTDASFPAVEPEPVHVSEEPELAREVADPGAEDGAGAEIHVHEPWEGYARSNARDVITRLATAEPAELAAVQLYESGHQGRQTILAAVERVFRKANGSGSPTQERNR